MIQRSGLALLHLQAGDSMPVVHHAEASARLVAVAQVNALSALHHAAATTTTEMEIAEMIVTVEIDESAVTEIARAAQRTATVT